jgi:hypothetical protein
MLAVVESRRKRRATVEKARPGALAGGLVNDHQAFVELAGVAQRLQGSPAGLPRALDGEECVLRAAAAVAAGARAVAVGLRHAADQLLDGEAPPEALVGAETLNEELHDGRVTPVAAHEISSSRTLEFPGPGGWATRL